MTPTIRSAAFRTMAAPASPTSGSKPSIAVLPFRLIGIAGEYAPMADALPHELITSLSRLRWLFVIARGSTFRFRSTEPDVRNIGEVLNVGYVLSGAVEIIGSRMKVTVELGRKKMRIFELLNLTKGSVVELEKVAGEPLDVMVNDQLVARGEAVVINDKFGVRLTDVVDRKDRVSGLG